jgi:hypothetical protein
LMLLYIYFLTSCQSASPKKSTTKVIKQKKEKERKKKQCLESLKDYDRS